MASANEEDGKPANWLGRNDGKGGQGWYGNALWAGDPTRPDLVVVGGIDLWKSEDGGQTLVRISNDGTVNNGYGADWRQTRKADGTLTPTSPHADQHAIVAHPQFDGKTNRMVFVGNDGGVFMTADIYTAGMTPTPTGPKDVRAHTDGWVMLNGGYCATQFYSIAGSAKTGRLMGGAQDNGTFEYVPRPNGQGGDWFRLDSGDGGFAALSPDGQFYYGESQYMDIFRTGKKFVRMDGLGAARAKANDAPLFVAPLVLDPNDPKRLFAGGSQLWRTNDATADVDPKKPGSGPQWSSIKEAVSAAGGISAIAVAKGNPDLIWVGHEKGHVFRTTRGTAPRPQDWQPVGQAGANRLPLRYCTRIVIDPANSQRVYVTYGGYFEDNVWRTDDGGTTWHNLSASLKKEAKVPVFTLAIHPQKSDFLYIGTEMGVWASEDGGRTWSVGNEGPANCRVDELTWLNQTLVAATHARGAFATDLTLAAPPASGKDNNRR
jgi:hypothetical protein